MLIKINDDHFLFGPRFSSPKLHHAIFHEFKLTSNRMLRGGQRRIYIVYSGFADVPPVKFRGILFPINWTVAFNPSRIHLDMAYMGLRFPETQGDIKILFNLS